MEKNLKNTVVIGTGSNYERMFDVTVSAGRFFSAMEVKTSQPVAVIGHTVRETLFPDENPVGKRIVIDGNRFRVIGTIGEQGKFLGLFSMDKQVLVPFPVAKNISGNWKEDLYISVKMKKNMDMARAEDELRMTVRALRGLKPSEKDDFSLNRQEMFRKQVGKIRLAIAAAGMGITSLSLLVGGIGIMNIMFVSVAERTKEIGIRKALGASGHVVLIQFIGEAVLISLAGGLTGVVLTFFLVDELNRFFPATLSMKHIVIALSASAATGVLSGIIPARRAASLNPVDSMRQ